ncbi:ABC transporter ATP-binding protein [Clostridium hydrogenum]|uniref:ABC transporter ATP-binding protein n=1 Tax=Clostridium hydrogenum TaxID=2855764 RepID=UPI001F2A06A8|nr:ABC transporter ATP-binding protein [Clostridium hydrogenum]
MAKDLLEVKNLKTYFHTEEGIVKAIDDISFKIKEKETVAIVGESGCGKSMTAMSIMSLVPKPIGKIEGGEIVFKGENMLAMSKNKIRDIRGNQIALIFQEPMTSLNPVFTIGYQIEEVLILHKKIGKKEAKEEAIKLLSMVKVPRAEEIINCYPYELSGGMRQRVVIAMAIACKPKLLIADEPTTALDVTIQAQILDIMRELKEKINTSILLITHDLGVVAEMADYVVVMYSGKIVEKAPVMELYENPRHPYTIGLLKSKPVINKLQNELYSIKGQVPNPLAMPEGCYFNPRCNMAKDICKKKKPSLKEVGEGHYVSCWLYEEGK